MTSSFLEVMLRNGKAPSLDMLLALVPDEPLLVAEPYESFTPGTGEVIVTMRGDYKIVHWKWRKSDLALRERFPGLQLDYHFREARKYNLPYGEPLSVWVSELLTTAKMHWSRAVQAYANGWAKSMGLGIHCTNLQFRDWLPGYMKDVNWFEGGSRPDDRGDEAAQLIRIACGLPRFAPTRRVRQ
ncbi:MAG: hypothetical protein M3Z96_00500 [Pseudomonadota bacterium]|nr:hypothetical protein [Pseudomonadota bacterium]MDQ6867244.1 hypothetical protein [Pseudomonadota bacterium]